MPEIEKSPPRILIVDDDEVMLLTTQALLEAQGYEVSTHAGAFGASRLILSAAPDLVLLDLNMPGLSGAGLAKLVRSQDSERQIRILFYSASDDETLQAAVEESEADGFIRKGDRTELRERIAAALAD